MSPRTASRNGLELQAQSKERIKNHSLRHQLASRVRILRMARDWSQDDLGKASGLHRTYVSLVERELCNISLDNVARLADAFGVAAADLLGSGGFAQCIFATNYVQASEGDNKS